jgi:hypothetical protein
MMLQDLYCIISVSGIREKVLKIYFNFQFLGQQTDTKVYHIKFT